MSEMKFVLIILLICSTVLVRSVSGNVGTYLYGLFSLTNCTGQYQCQNAQINAQRMLKLYKPSQHDVLKLCIKDIQEDVSLLYDVLFGIIDPDDDKVEMSGICKGKNGIKFAKRSKMFVFTYLSFALTRIVSSILLVRDVVVVSVTEEKMYPSYYLEHPLSFYSDQLSLGQGSHETVIKKFMKQLRIDNVIILSLNVANSDGDAVSKGFLYGNRTKTRGSGSLRRRCEKEFLSPSAFCFYVTHHPQSCFSELTVNLRKDNVTQILKELKTERYNFIMLDGPADLIGEFKVTAGSIQLYAGSPFYFGFVQLSKELLYDDSRNQELSYSNGALINFPGAFGINTFMQYVHEASYTLMNSALVWNGFKRHKQFRDQLQFFGFLAYYEIIKYDPTFQRGAIMTFETWSKIPEPRRQLVINSILSERETYIAALEQGKDLFYPDVLTLDYLKTQFYFNPMEALRDCKKCNDSIPICKPGQELQHGYFKNVNWSASYGWHCKKCGKGFYKTSIGNKQCAKCDKPNRVNKDRTKCFDPYTLSYLNSADPIPISWLAFSGLIFIMVFATSVIFIYYRTTPIVLSSNKEMTVLQLLFHLILTITLPVMFIGTFHQSTCYARPIVIGISLSIILTVNLSKTQKLFLVFAMKVRVSTSQKLLTNSLEWLIILVVILVDGVLLAVSFTNQNDPPDAIFKYDNYRLVKEQTCNNNDVVLTQLFFILFLVFLNCIQGYRARSLPSYFKENTHVIYSSFFSVILLIATTSIYFLQTKHLVREITIIIAAGTLNFVNFALIYLYKVYIILFHPERNSKSVFHEERKRKIQQRFDKKTIKKMVKST
ncbi:uncharacterized protein [Clytia hemisphaerica]|uniref:G-protein coupled receptors family 3 profile domain-containing protein n=1 Tax=Clytia hemisphaerica TaxID=252671 RepID=A0A7M5V4Z8_9CNID